METLDIGLQLPPIDAPHAAPPEFYRGKVARPNQGVHLRDRHAQVDRDIFERQEACLDDGLGTAFFIGRRRAGHFGTIAPGAVGYRYLTLFAAVWVGTRAI